MPRLSYPDSDRRARTVKDPEEAVATAYQEANDETVEVHDGDVLLVRYEKRVTPLEFPEPEPEPVPEDSET